MVDLVYGSAAIDRLRAAVAAEALRLPTLARPAEPPPAAAFGGVAGAGALAASLAELRAVLDAELAAGAARLDAAAGALGAAAEAVRATDERAASGATPP